MLLRPAVLCARRGENLPERRMRLRSPGPLLGIAERNFLEPDAVDHARLAYMEVARHHHRRAEAAVPVRGAPGSAPDAEPRDARDVGKLGHQRKMIDEHGGA